MIRLPRMIAAALALGFFLAAPPALAQPVPPDAAAEAKTSASDTAKTAAEIEALVRTLKDDAERQKLIDRLELLLSAQRNGGAAKPDPATTANGLGTRLLSALSDGVEGAGRNLVSGLRAVFDLGRLRDWAVGQWSSPEVRARWIDLLWKAGAALLAGVLASWVVRLLLTTPRRALESRVGGPVWRRVPPLILHTLLELVPVAAFMAAGYAALTLAQADRTTRLVALALINAHVAASLILAAARLALSPAAPGLRLPPASDETANYLYLWARRIGHVAVYGYVAAQAARLLGLPADGAAALLHVVGLFVALMLVVFVLQNRSPVAAWIRGPDGQSASIRLIRARLGDIWHVLAIVYLLGMYVVWALSIRGGFRFVLQATLLTVLIAVAARLALFVFGRTTRRVFALSSDVRRRFPGLEARANRYLPVVERIGAIAIYVVAAIAMLEVWGVDSFDLLASDAGRGLARAVVTSLIIVVVAALVWEMVSAWIERYLARESAEGVVVSARARTLLPLLRTTVMAVLVTIVGLVVLSQFGVNIAPLLAGAGVIGLAVGFGSQTLVKDVITGAFILAEDQMAVGDVVKLGPNSGLVERLTLRAIWLRALDGTLQVIPFGEVKTVENMTKDYSRYVFNVAVAYREDTDRVVEILKEIAAELQQDSEYAPLITEPFEVLGVDSFGDSAVIIKARITTKPIQQWKVGREFNRRMKKRFDAEGIEIPFPHRTVYFGIDKQGNAPPARIAVAALADSADHAGGKPAEKRSGAAANPKEQGQGNG